MKIVSGDETGRRRRHRRERVLKTIAVLPSLATLGNLVCGLGAIYVCLLSIQASGTDLGAHPMGSERLYSLFPTFLAVAAYLVIGALFFDAMDGRLARWARRTSEFGGQLDSLADIVSFGVAPAVLVLCITHPGDVAALSSWGRVYWRAEWVMAATFVCCAALRLARFNVENEEDESSHLGFRGLPAPGAACAIVSLVVLHEDLLKDFSPAQASWLAFALPIFTMALGLLMVSRFHYSHIVNTLLRGRRPFRQVVGLVVILLGGLIVQFQLTVAVAAGAYALSGPAGGILRRLRGTRQMDEGLVPPTDSAWLEQKETFADAEDELTDEDEPDSARPAV